MFKMNMHRVRLLALVMAAALAAGGLLSPGIASASYNTCDTPAQNHFEGYVTNLASGSQPTNPEGVGGEMLVEFGNICQTDTNSGTNFSTTWDMIVSNDLKSYAQSGIMLRYGYSCWEWWAEQSLNGSFSDWYSGACATQGTTHHVWQQLVYISGSYYIRSNVDSTIIHQSSFDPIADWPKPFYAQFVGETTHDNSDVPGYTSTPTDFSSMEIQSFANDQWYDTCNNADFGLTQANRYSADAPSCDHVRIWTSG